MKDLHNNQVTALAIGAITIIAIVAMTCTSLMAQDYGNSAYAGNDVIIGQPWPEGLEETNIKLPRLFRTDSPAGTWMRADDLRDKRMNRGIASAVITAVYLPAAVVLGPLSVVDFFVTKRKLRKNANLISK